MRGLITDLLTVLPRGRLEPHRRRRHGAGRPQTMLVLDRTITETGRS
jgi:hypothetical protein